MDLVAQPRAHESRPQGSNPKDGSGRAASATCGPEATDGGRPALSVAILDQDSGFLTVLGNRLNGLGWTWRALPTRVRASTLRSIGADVLVVDVSILGPQRWRRLAGLCEQGQPLRVIVCSGPSTVGERVCALRAGAADWLNKPCHPEELIARIEAVAGHRRPFVHAASDSRWVGELEIRPHQFQAFVDGDSVSLTRREYQLIDVLAGGGGDVVAREAVYRAIWKSEMALHDRSVDVLVHKVRRKLERTSPDWAFIHTHYGQGYRLAPERTAPIQGPVQLRCRAPEPTTLAA